MVAMNTEDILKFMLSDFVLKGVFDQIFDKEVDWTGPPELVTLMQGQVAVTAALQPAAQQSAVRSPAAHRPAANAGASLA